MRAMWRFADGHGTILENRQCEFVPQF